MRESIEKTVFAFVVLGALLGCKKLGLGGSESEGSGASASAAANAYPESVEGLRQLATDLTTAAASDPSKAEQLARGLALPDASAWFTKTFGAETGKKLADDYAPTAAKLPSVGGFFLDAKSKGKTDVSVVKHASAPDLDANALQNDAMKAMQAPVPLYTIRLVKPGEELGSSLWSFAYVDGGFRFVGKMKPIKPDASPFDELSLKEVGKALEGK